MLDGRQDRMLGDLHLVLRRRERRVGEHVGQCARIERAGEDRAERRAVAVLWLLAAIGDAIRMARAGDIVLVAGKGHEQGQEFEDGRKIPFDDREVAREALRRLGAPA